jgi:hypothetical protein
MTIFGACPDVTVDSIAYISWSLLLSLYFIHHLTIQSMGGSVPWRIRMASLVLVTHAYVALLNSLLSLDNGLGKFISH